MKRRLLLVPLLLVGACAPSSPTSSARDQPSTGAPPSAAAGRSPAPGPAETLMVVLESSSGDLQAPDTIAIAGLDGVARAKARFKPRALPWVAPLLGPVLPQVAHVAAGRAYYVDAGGAVRSLGVTGDVRQETRFPVTDAQQEVSFAVRPDGRQLAGAVVTLPAEPDPPPTPGYTPTTPYSMDLMTAASGSSATVTEHRTWTAADRLGSGAQLIGWDVAGPVATWPSILGTQGGGAHQYNGVNLVHLPGGKLGSALPAPGGCYAMDLLPTGVLLCGPGNATLQVLGPDGAVRWRYSASQPGVSLLYGFLSPDAGRVVIFGTGGTSTVLPQSGPPVAMPFGFTQSGWIGSDIVAGTVQPTDNVSYVRLASPDRATDLGFKGQFVGAIVT